MDIHEPTVQMSHLSQATAEDEDAVRSSRPMGEEHPSRSLPDTGIVDERQTPVWPEFCEGAQTRMRRVPLWQRCQLVPAAVAAN